MLIRTIVELDEEEEEGEILIEYDSNMLSYSIVSPLKRELRKKREIERGRACQTM